MGTATSVPKAQVAVLDLLSPWIHREGLVLVGGTALTVHLGHRRSRDLDLFSRKANLHLPRIRHELVATKRASVLALEGPMLRLMIDRVPVDLVDYPFPPIQRLRKGPAGVPVAGLRDLAAMKLAAIARRGIRRDFWDLHAILTMTSTRFSNAIEAYRSKYGAEVSDLYPVMRSLTYFDDAESDDVWPPGLRRNQWADIKRDFQAWVPRYFDSMR